MTSVFDTRPLSDAETALCKQSAAMCDSVISSEDRMDVLKLSKAVASLTNKLVDLANDGNKEAALTTALAMSKLSFEAGGAHAFDSIGEVFNKAFGEGNE